MRFLKKKIQASLQAQQKIHTRNIKSQTSSKGKKYPFKDKETINRMKDKRKKRRGRPITPKMYLQTKNIVTNFGKAMVSFAVSDLAQPYLNLILEKLNQEGKSIQLANFLDFMGNVKGSITSVESFRSMMLEEKNDSEMNILCKKIFRSIGEVFIKYFSVNWIIHGKVTYKMIHLKFRYKMLRRIQNPLMFANAKSNSKQLKNEKV